MSGKAAAFGGRMMSSVADQVLKQFADNFAAQVQALQAQAPTPRRRRRRAAAAGTARLPHLRRACRRRARRS